MKKSSAILLLIFYSIASYAQQEYVKNLQNLAVITFPDTPKSRVNLGDTIYFTKVNGLVYLAAATEASIGVKDLIAGNKLQKVYDQLLKGTLEGAHGRLFYRKNITLHDLNGLEFGYVAKNKSITYYGYVQTYYFNQVIVDYAVLADDSLKSDDPKLKQYFKTFKVTIKDDEIRQNDASELAYKGGQIIALLLIIAAIALIGFGVVYIIKKIAYR